MMAGIDHARIRLARAAYQAQRMTPELASLTAAAIPTMVGGHRALKTDTPAVGILRVTRYPMSRMDLQVMRTET